MSVENFLRRLIAAEKGESEGDISDEPPPLNHDADFVAMTWLERRLHKIYPRAGGLEDQDDLLMDDWVTMSLWYIRVQAGVFSAMTMPADGSPIEDLLGG